MTETRRLRAEWTWCPFCGHAATSHSDKFLKGCRANDETPHGCQCEILPALLSEPQAAPAPQVVYVVDGGDYENYGWNAVYDSLDAAILDNPLPEMRAIIGKQCDPTFALSRAGGWMPVTNHPRSPLGEWWNGFHSDFGKYIQAVKLRESASPVVPAPPEDQKPQVVRQVHPYRENPYADDYCRVCGDFRAQHPAAPPEDDKEPRS
jgi:hypothetical protein